MKLQWAFAAVVQIFYGEHLAVVCASSSLL